MLLGQPDLVVVGESSTGMDTLDLCASLQPDLVLLDLSLGTLNGMDLVKKINRDFPKIYILVFSAFNEDNFAVRALKSGASGFISKEQAADELLIAIRTVLSGKKYISAAVANSLADWALNNDLRPLHSDLTDRELQTVELMASGLKLSEIGEQLCISSKTVSMYRHRVLLKLGLRNNAELIAYAIQNKLTVQPLSLQDDDGPE